MTLPTCPLLVGIDKMTEKAAPDEGHRDPTLQELASSTGSHNVQPPNEIEDPTSSSESRSQAEGETDQPKLTKSKSLVNISLFIACNCKFCIIF